MTRLTQDKAASLLRRARGRCPSGDHELGECETMEECREAMHILQRVADGSLKLGGPNACPKCGVEDIDAPCVGQEEFGSEPLSYRHAGRVPPSNQRRLA